MRFKIVWISRGVIHNAFTDSQITAGEIARAISINHGLVRVHQGPSEVISFREGRVALDH